MKKVIGYLRVSTEKQTTESQKLAIYDYATKNHLKIDSFIEVTVSSKKSTEHRKINELLKRLKENDVLIVSELSRLGRSVIELLTLVKQITDNGITLVMIKQNLLLSKNDNSLSNKVILSTFSLLAEIERDLIIQRTKEGLSAARAKGKILGKPKGTIQSSFYDKHKERIKEYLKKRISITNITRLIGLGNYQSLRRYIRKRKLFQCLPFSS